MYELLLAGLLQGLILAFVAYGVMIPLRLLQFADLTAEGAYPLGGALCASLLLLGMPPVIALLIATISAGIIGMATALIHLRFQINTLLAGILISTMLYSINLRIMGKPNIGLFDTPTLLTFSQPLPKIGMVFLLLLIFLAPLAFLLKTEIGLRLRAVGFNPEFAKRQGISIPLYTMVGLFIGNAYTGFAGGIIVQIQSYMDINLGVGVVIHALAAIMIGECIITPTSVNKQLLAPLVGALVYQQIQGLALTLGLMPSDTKLLTGSIVIGVIALQRKKIL